MLESKYLHEVVITAIIVKDGKFLITRRSVAEEVAATIRIFGRNKTG